MAEKNKQKKTNLVAPTYADGQPLPDGSIYIRNNYGFMAYYPKLKPTNNVPPPKKEETKPANNTTSGDKK